MRGAECLWAPPNIMVGKNTDNGPQSSVFTPNVTSMTLNNLLSNHIHPSSHIRRFIPSKSNCYLQNIKTSWIKEFQRDFFLESQPKIWRENVWETKWEVNSFFLTHSQVFSHYNLWFAQPFKIASASIGSLRMKKDIQWGPARLFKPNGIQIKT